MSEEVKNETVTLPPEYSEPPQDNRPVRVINQGAPFEVDLRMFGYGTRWPSKAVYTLTMSAYLKCLKDGLNGNIV